MLVPISLRGKLLRRFYQFSVTSNELEFSSGTSVLSLLTFFQSPLVYALVVVQVIRPPDRYVSF